MPHSLTDLAGLGVGTEDFLAAILEAAAQPIWVLDPDGLIRFANPAALAAVGYDSADELLGCHSHDTIHHSHPDGTPYPAADCPLLRVGSSGETASSELDWFFRRDGSMFPVAYTAVPVKWPHGQGAVVAFTDIEDRLNAEQVLRDHGAVLAAQQAGLRRVAALVSGGAPSADVFAAIATEVGRVLRFSMVATFRYEADGTVAVVGAWGDRPHPFHPGTCWPLDGLDVQAQALLAGRPTRIEDFAGLSGTIATTAHAINVRSGAYAPIIVDGRPWGVMGASPAAGQPLPERVEHRLMEFTELVGAAISNTQSRDQLKRLADEQAALRRVATLVAEGSTPAKVFEAVGDELARLLNVPDMRMVRYGDDDVATIVSSREDAEGAVSIGTRMPLGGHNISTLVNRTGRPARIDDYSEATGAAAEHERKLGARSGLGSPIVVDGQVWGAMLATSRQEEPIPPGTENRIGEFTQLLATAIANIEARVALAASRARIVAATDDERRRVVRDLHDGAQQRLVHTVVMLKLASRALDEDQDRVPELIRGALDQAARATAELRELAHGILPAVLTHGGLRAGIGALASRMPVPVEVDVGVARLPAAVEATAYFVVAEALTNVAKHARAERAAVTARADDECLRVEVHDDGVGGANPDGPGLVGLQDRLATLDGRLRIESPEGSGTLIAATIPVPGGSVADR